MSTPFIDREFTFTQPDGSQLRVRGTGDQYAATFETLDGYTVLRDPASGFFHYAQVSAVDGELAPMGVRPGAVDPRQIGLTPRVRSAASGARAKLALNGLPRSPSRWETRRDQRRLALQAATRGAALAPPQRPTVGSFVGLCLLIEFPDVPGTISREEVEAFCNQRGYSGFGNAGSVFDYFFDVSGTKLRYTNAVAPYYTTKHPRSYYTNPSIPQPQRTWELIKEALFYHLDAGFDFGHLTSDNQQFIYAINVFYSCQRVNNWSEGLWPHAFHLPSPQALAPGKLAYDYQITDMGHELSLGTFCHENGHMICDFPDLYDYGYESNGTGVFCLMCAGGSGVFEKNPAHVGAYLKYSAGWASSAKSMRPGDRFNLPTGANEFALHRKNQTEYFIVENRTRAGRDAGLADEGLAIWHVDELGSNNNEQRLPGAHYECTLVQADGQHHLEERVNNGDDNDLFPAGENDTFSDTSRPNSRWWDGTPSGLSIQEISAAGGAVTFSVGSGATTAPVGTGT